MPAESDSVARCPSTAMRDISLLEILDHVLNSGVVIHGSLVISLAGVDLVYVGLNVVLTSVETALRNMKRLHPSRRADVRRGFHELQCPVCSIALPSQLNP